MAISKENSQLTIPGNVLVWSGLLSRLSICLLMSLHWSTFKPLPHKSTPMRERFSDGFRTDRQMTKPCA
jgi:hypothetical protein